jgi:hypothetical protein
VYRSGLHKAVAVEYGEDPSSGHREIIPEASDEVVQTSLKVLRMKCMAQERRQKVY